MIKYDKTTNYKDLSCLEKNFQFKNHFNLLHETTKVNSRAKLLQTTPPSVPPKNSKVKDVAVRDDNNKENIKPKEVKNKIKKTEMEPKTTKQCK